jgi:hypothetical protein
MCLMAQYFNSTKHVEVDNRRYYMKTSSLRVAGKFSLSCFLDMSEQRSRVDGEQGRRVGSFEVSWGMPVTFWVTSEAPVRLSGEAAPYVRGLAVYKQRSRRRER